MDFEKRGAELVQRIAAAQRRRRRGKVYPPELRRVSTFHDIVGWRKLRVCAECACETR